MFLIRFLGNLLLFVVRWVIPLIGLGVLVLIPILYTQMGGFLNEKVQVELSKIFPDLSVAVNHVEIVSGKGIRISGIDVKIPVCLFTGDAENLNEQIKALVLPREKSGRLYLQYDFLHLDELFLYGNTDLQNLARGRFEPTSAHINGATVSLYPIDSVRWNFQVLKSGKSDRLLPELVLNDLDCTITDYRKKGAIYHLRDFQTSLKLDKTGKEYVIQGSLSGDYARKLDFTGRFNPSEKRFQTEGNVAECELSARLFNNLPEEWLPKDEFSRNLIQTKVEKNIQGLLSFGFNFRYNKTDSTPLRYSIQGSVTNGRWDWADLPTPLTKLESHFVVSNEGAYIKSLTGNCGDGRLSLTYRQISFAPKAPLALQARLENIELNPRMATILPEKIQKGWDMLKPSGRLNASLGVSFDGENWKSTVYVDCLDAGLQYANFPYPLSHLNGTVRWENQKLTLDLKDSRNMAISAHLAFPPTGVEGQFSLLGKQVPVDEKLCKACPEKAEELICSFAPKGNVDIDFSMMFKGNKQAPDKRLIIKIINCEGRYDKFPYPLYAVNGVVEMNNDRWTFYDFQARNNNTGLTGEGSLNLVEGEAHDFLLNLVLGGVPLDKTLLAAMPKENADLLDNLGVAGVFDADVSVRMRLGVDSKPNIRIRAVPRGGDASICARCLPYRIENLSGEITFSDNCFHIENFAGAHDQARFGCQIDGALIPGEGWAARLTGTTVDQLQMNRELLEALPESVRRLLSAINLSGPLYYRGNLNLAFVLDFASPFCVSWNGELGIQEGSLGRGFKLRGVSGGLTTSGAWVQDLFYSQGELDIKSLLWEDMQFSQITGPYRMNNKSLYLGSAAFDAGKKMYPDLVDSFETVEMDRMRSAMDSLFDCEYLKNWRRKVRATDGTAGMDAIADTTESGNIEKNAVSNAVQQFFVRSSQEDIPAFNSAANLGATSGTVKARSLRSRIYGGDVFADLAILFEPQPYFGVYVTGQNLRLEQCTTLTQSERLSGKAQLAARLRGNLDNLNSLWGRGEFRLSEADIYELPAMVSLLKLLSIRRPDTNAFSNAEATFRLTGPHVFFERINFRGDAISLYGTGDMDFNKRVNLSFYTLMGRGEVAIPVVNDLFRGVSKQLMLIRMEGPVNNLRTWREVPMVNDSLRQVEQELNTGGLQTLPPPPGATKK